jgi:hypothetical protein
METGIGFGIQLKTKNENLVFYWRYFAKKRNYKIKHSKEGAKHWRFQKRGRKKTVKRLSNSYIWFSLGSQKYGRMIQFLNFTSGL